jgi:hypothetical protein
LFAINHAATALVIKKRFPAVSIVWLLLSVQLVELIWVALNYLGIEQTLTEESVNSVADIHLAYMPFSHSIVSSLIIAVLAWIMIRKLFRRPTVALAVAIGILSHIILDVVTHSQDIAVVPFVWESKIGLGLYELPLLAFFVETAYGVFCWWYFGGGKALLATILIFNLANFSFFSTAANGPEALMANHPLWIVTAVAMQIIVSLTLVGYFARRDDAMQKQPADNIR